jgi:hypothetical protein
MLRLVKSVEKRPEHSTVINWTVPVYIKNGEDYYKVCFDIKRKPLPDGTLPLTDKELVCIKKMTGAIFALGVKIVYSRLEYVLPNGHFDTKCVESVRVILWLAERFELIKED